MNSRRTLTLFIPTFSNARSVLTHIDGLSAAQYRAIQLYIEDELRKEYPSPSSVQRHAEPLSTESRRIARSILAELKESNGDGRSPPNVKFLEGIDSLSKVHNLIVYRDGCVFVTNNGKRLLQMDEDFVANIDLQEGFFFILQKLVELGPQRTIEVKELFDTFRFNTLDPERLNTGYHFERLKNLLDRCFITERKNAKDNVYEITSEGRAYIRRNANVIADSGKHSCDESVAKSLNSRFLDELRKWDPFEFERLIACLFEEMGYSDVEVTQKSYDKGADIVATLRSRVSTLPIAIQVKRYSKDVGRDVLDRLRGSLHRFHTAQGIIVTTAGFAFSAQEASKEMGALPIRLIDGEELIELLLEHNMVESRNTDGFLSFRSHVMNYVKHRSTQE